MTNRFSFDPNPAEEGVPVRICYDFTDVPPGEVVHVTVAFVGVTDQPQQLTLTAANNCADVHVPNGCESIHTIDQSGRSEESSVSVNLPAS